MGGGLRQVCQNRGKRCNVLMTFDVYVDDVG